MTAQAISTASLICAGRPQRAAMLCGDLRRKPSGYVTEFHEGMLGTGRRKLGQGELLSVQGIDATLVCLAGELWLTRHADAGDYILGAGCSLHLSRDDRAVVQALQTSRVRLIPACGLSAASAPDALHAVAQARRDRRRAVIGTGDEDMDEPAGRGRRVLALREQRDLVAHR